MTRARRPLLAILAQPSATRYVGAYDSRLSDAIREVAEASQPFARAWDTAARVVPPGKPPEGVLFALALGRATARRYGCPSNAAFFSWRAHPIPGGADGRRRAVELAVVPHPRAMRWWAKQANWMEAIRFLNKLAERIAEYSP